MRRTSQLFILISASLLAGTLTNACKTGLKKEPAERQTKHTFVCHDDTSRQMNYLLYLPETYPKRKELYPLLLFLHGSGERGNDLELVKTHGPPKLADTQDFPFIIVSPQCPPDQRWDIDLLHDVLVDIMAQYRVDPHRIYLTGLSMGGEGTWALAAAYPEYFAAIAPVCGKGDTLTVTRLIDIPVWNFHGALDPDVPIQRSHEMVRALKDAGGNVKFTIYPDATHDSWTETYNKEELYEWFLEQSKNTHDNPE